MLKTGNYGKNWHYMHQIFCCKNNNLLFDYLAQGATDGKL